MALYLLPLPKTDSDVEVQPWQSMGGKAFDPDDPESMEYLRKLCEEKRQQVQPWQRSWLTPVFALFGFHFPPENPTATNFRERWDRPFKDILAEATATPDRYLVREYDPEVFQETQYLSDLEYFFPWFPFDLLFEFTAADGEPRTNHVVTNDWDAQNAFFSFEGQGPKQPDEMRSIAEIFEKASASHEPKPDHDFPEESVLAIRAAAEWLRFWADRSHPCETQRLIWSGQGWCSIHVG